MAITVVDKDHPGRVAVLGMGFVVREVAFDFKTLLKDHVRRVEFRQQSKTEAAPARDYSIPEGKKISLSLGGKSSEEKKKKKKATSGLLEIPAWTHEQCGVTKKPDAKKEDAKQNLDDPFAAPNPFPDSIDPFAPGSSDPFPGSSEDPFATAADPFGDSFAPFPELVPPAEGAAADAGDPFGSEDAFAKLSVDGDPFGDTAGPSPFATPG